MQFFNFARPLPSPLGRGAQFSAVFGAHLFAAESSAVQIPKTACLFYLRPLAIESLLIG